MNILRVSNLQRPGLKPTSLTIAGGQTLCIHGPSGSGKTLLLRAIADLDPNQGEVSIDEQPRKLMPAHHWGSQVSYLPTSSHWWQETVGEHSTQWNQHILLSLGFEPDVLTWQIRRLSSGEKQRLGLARVLNHQPKALLLDEPTANLDASNSTRVEAIIRDYQQSHQASILWVSHQPAQRERMADQQRRILAGELMA